MSAFAAWALPPGSDEPSRIALSSGEEDEFSFRHPVLSEEEMRGLCAALRRSRDEVLLARSVDSLVERLGAVGERFLEPSDPLRREAMELVRENAGLSPAMSWEVVRGMARDWTRERIGELVRAEFPDPGVLDGFRSAPGGGRTRAMGPRLIVHVGAGTVPGVSVTSLLRALLVKTPVLVKPGRSDAVLPVLFARALADDDPELARALAVVYWPGGEGMAEEVALGQADHVVVHGGDDTVQAVRERLPPTTRLTAYHHRVSFGAVGREALVGEETAVETARSAARAVAVFDQRGCVSPHLFYVEEGGSVAPRRWAALLAEALDEIEEELPAGPLLPEEASAVQQVRGAAEMRAAAGEEVEMHAGEDLAWTVIFEPTSEFQASCLGRLVRVEPIPDLLEIAGRLEGLGSVLQTVGLAGAGARAEAVAEALARAGVSRVAPLESVPWPPPWWHHDGVGPLGALARWIDVEDGSDPAGDRAGG